jgi:hypothetical protein
MKTNYLKLISTVLFACTIGMITSCTKSNDPAVQTGTAEFQITDAPSDDANVKGVFVTVTDIKVDGNSVTGFTKQTIDLNALQDGKTQLLGTSTLTAKSYSAIVLVLDTDTDASGGTPGCYVQTVDNAKYKLRSSGAINLTVNKSWSVPTNGKSTVVIDFDLRKAIKDMSDQAVKYNFVSDSNLGAAVRLTTKESSGTISGTYAEQISSGADKVVVYAYKKGTFNMNTEPQAQTDDGIYFKNAVSSAMVKNSGLSNTYTLSFLESGDYEVHFAAYKKSATSDKFTLQGMLNATTTSGASTGGIITVQTGITASVSSTVSGF